MSHPFFTPEPSGLPDKRIRTAEAESLAARLAELLVKRAAGVQDIRQVSRRGAEYPQYDRVLSRLPGVWRLSDGESADFFQALYDEYRHYDAPGLQDAWVKAVGYIVEHTFVVLMQKKYAGVNCQHFPEHLVNIPPPPRLVSTGAKPIDVIVWSDAFECGEFLEVKKNLDTKANDISFVDKVQTMFEFALDLAERKKPPSIVGVATLSESPLAERLVRSILIEGGFILEGTPLAQVNPSFSIIKLDTLAAWYAQKVI